MLGETKPSSPIRHAARKRSRPISPRSNGLTKTRLPRKQPFQIALAKMQRQSFPQIVLAELLRLGRLIRSDVAARALTDSLLHCGCEHRKVSASLANSLRFLGSVAKSRIRAHSAASQL